MNAIARSIVSLFAVVQGRGFLFLVLFYDGSVGWKQCTETPYDGQLLQFVGILIYFLFIIYEVTVVILLREHYIIRACPFSRKMRPTKTGHEANAPVPGMEAVYDTCYRQSQGMCTYTIILFVSQRDKQTRVMTHTLAIIRLLTCSGETALQQATRQTGAVASNQLLRTGSTTVQFG